MFSKKPHTQGLTHSAVLLFLGRKGDGLRIYLMVGLFMLALYFWKSGQSAPMPHEKALREIAPPENYYGASEHQQHGYLGLMRDEMPSWVPAARPPRPASQEQLEKELSENGFFIKLSDSLSLDRNVTDFRHALCPTVRYPRGLPPAAVIFVFRNEALSTLLRSIHSVLNRSPPALLKEVCLSARITQPAPPVSILTADHSC